MRVYIFKLVHFNYIVSFKFSCKGLQFVITWCQEETGKNGQPQLTKIVASVSNRRRLFYFLNNFVKNYQIDYIVNILFHLYHLLFCDWYFSTSCKYIGCGWPLSLCPLDCYILHHANIYRKVFFVCLICADMLYCKYL